MDEAKLFSAELRAQAERVLARARAQGATLVTAESCTGGLVAGALTEVAGASDVLERGYVVYSNDAKTELLAVPASLIASFGAVSAQVAAAMAAGALMASPARFAVAVTGIAGPGGGTQTKPVGLVWFALQRRGEPAKTLERRYGDIGRSAVRLAAVAEALTLLESGLD